MLLEIKELFFDFDCSKILNTDYIVSIEPWFDDFDGEDGVKIVIDPTIAKKLKIKNEIYTTYETYRELKQRLLMSKKSFIPIKKKDWDVDED
jgi:hypothetical protein